jgi:hypothetical protein
MMVLSVPGLGTLYAAPAGTWQAVEARVTLALRAQSIAAQMTSILPSFPKLVDASENWRQSLWPGLFRQAGTLHNFVTQFLPELQTLRQAAARYGPSDPLPPVLAVEVRSALDMLYRYAGGASVELAALASGLQQFAQVNQDIDIELARYKGPLAASWPVLAAQITDIETRLGRTAGTWRALASDVGEVTAPDFQVDMALLIQLDLDSAIAGWTQVEADVADFLQSTTTLQAAPC